MKPARSRTQPQHLGDTTRRIVRRLDRKRQRAKGVNKPLYNADAARANGQLELPFTPSDNKDQPNDET